MTQTLTPIDSETKGPFFSFKIWLILLSFFVLHVLRQIYYFYKFLNSEAMLLLREHLSFRKDILPSFLLSVFTTVRVLNITGLGPNIAANAGIKILHTHPCRSKYHTFYSEVHGYKSNLVIAIDTDERVTAFRQAMGKFLNDRITSGMLQKIAAEGVLKWIEKGSVDVIDIAMFLESLVMRFLYDINPEEVYTPAQRLHRAKVYLAGIKWVLIDAYRPMGSFYAVLWHNTGIDFDPVRRPIIKAATELWEDIYDKQVKLMKSGKKCLLAAFLKDPVVGKLDMEFIKANFIQAIMAGQFLTSISNTVGMLYNLGRGDKPNRHNKANWMLQLVSDWSPLFKVLRTYEGFVVQIPCTGNSRDLHRSFSLGQRQCPGKGMALRAYQTMAGILGKYKITMEGLENPNIRPQLWPFTNTNLRFRIEKPEQNIKPKGAELRRLRTTKTIIMNKVSSPVRTPSPVKSPNKNANQTETTGAIKVKEINKINVGKKATNNIMKRAKTLIL